MESHAAVAGGVDTLTMEKAKYLCTLESGNNLKKTKTNRIRLSGKFICQSVILKLSKYTISLFKSADKTGTCVRRQVCNWKYAGNWASHVQYFPSMRWIYWQAHCVEDQESSKRIRQQAV